MSSSLYSSVHQLCEWSLIRGHNWKTSHALPLRWLSDKSLSLISDHPIMASLIQYWRLTSNRKRFGNECNAMSVRTTSRSIVPHSVWAMRWLELGSTLHSISCDSIIQMPLQSLQCTKSFMKECSNISFAFTLNSKNGLGLIKLNEASRAKNHSPYSMSALAKTVPKQCLTPFYTSIRYHVNTGATLG